MNWPFFGLVCRGDSWFSRFSKSTDFLLKSSVLRARVPEWLLIAGKVFRRQISTLLENASPIFWQHEMLSLPRFGHFPARKTDAGNSAPPSGTLLDFLLWDRHSLLEFFWLNCTETQRKPGGWSFSFSTQTARRGISMPRGKICCEPNLQLNRKLRASLLREEQFGRRERDNWGREAASQNLPRGNGETIFDSQLSSPKMSFGMPPKLPLPPK